MFMRLVKKCCRRKALYQATMGEWWEKIKLDSGT